MTSVAQVWCRGDDHPHSHVAASCRRPLNRIESKLRLTRVPEYFRKNLAGSLSYLAYSLARSGAQ